MHVHASKLTCLSLVALAAARPVLAAEWNHDPASGVGPMRWGQMLVAPDPLFRTCGAILDEAGVFRETGRSQSPVDIPAPATLSSDLLPPLGFAYRDTPLEVENNGHVVEVPYAPGSRLVIGADSYELLQFHFHAPSEHLVSGRSYDMEMHLVHRNALGNLAVVGVLLEACAPGDAGCRPNREIEQIMLEAPITEGSAHVEGRSIDARRLLPADGGYYLYAGSLTTPPCSEGVRWHLMTSPVQVSAATVQRLRVIVGRFPAYGGFAANNRPVMPLNGRAVFERRLP